MQQVMAELQALGALDPAAQKQLMADLQQNDPALWPLMLQQFRAAAAYRRRANQSEMAAADQGPGLVAAGVARPSPGTPTAAPGRPPLVEVARPPYAGMMEPASAGFGSEPGFRPEGSGTPPVHVGRLPTLRGATLPPREAPDGNYPRTPHSPTVAVVPNGPAGVASQRTAPTGPEESHGSDDAADSQSRLAKVVRTMESQLQAEPKTPEEVAEHAKLRMLYLLAGRRDDAVRLIPSATPAMQEFWSKQLYGLATWLDVEGSPDAHDRAAQTKQILGEALSRLGESAPLVVRNLAFCTEIHSYGCYEKFRSYEFSPDQELLLYAEVENFASEPTAKGYHTMLRTSYQIFDTTGHRIDEHEFETTEEYCQNPRRDFFIGSHIYMPKRIPPGSYRLHVTVEDLKSRKVGESSIGLTIKGE